MMIRDSLSNAYQNEPPFRTSRLGQNVVHAQETIYTFLLDIVKKWPPEEVLLEFRRLFIHHVNSTSEGVVQAVYELVFANNEEEFHHTLKRCCYILINNWDASRHYKPIQELITVLGSSNDARPTPSPTLKVLRRWLHNFVTSQDYEELKLFASRYEDHGRGPWASRYTSYLLVPQYVDLKNPLEQREAARALSKQLRDRFKFDLAMYIARSQTRDPSINPPRNPTALGDEVLRLIKTIVARRGPFSYANLANIFLSQVQNVTYLEFKQSLCKYLAFSIENQEFVEVLQTKLGEKLDDLYASHHHELISSAMVLRTCNRVIEYLTTDQQTEPSSLFIQLLSKGNPLTLVIVLLKVILICKHSRTHLEARIADLIRYYQDYPEDECSWVVSFLEIFNVTFAIHAENVQYNLVKMKEYPAQPSTSEADMYRIFSQLRREEKIDLDPSIVVEEPDVVDEPDSDFLEN